MDGVVSGLEGYPVAFRGTFGVIVLLFYSDFGGGRGRAMLLVFGGYMGRFWGWFGVNFRADLRSCHGWVNWWLFSIVGGWRLEFHGDFCPEKMGSFG